MWDFKEAEKKEREARIAWLKEHAPGFDAMIHGLDIDHASHSLIVAAGVILRRAYTGAYNEQLVAELRETIHCSIQADLTKKPMKLGEKIGPEHEETQKWRYLAALHAHRAAVILADHVGLAEKITKALIDISDWHFAESVLWAAYNAAVEDNCGDDD